MNHFTRYIFTKILLMSVFGFLLTGAWCEPNLSTRPLKPDTHTATWKKKPSFVQAHVQVDLDKEFAKALSRGDIKRHIKGDARFNGNFEVQMSRYVMQTVTTEVKENRVKFCWAILLGWYACGVEEVVKLVDKAVRVLGTFNKWETIDATATYDLNLVKIETIATGKTVKLIATADVDASLGTSAKIAGIEAIKINGITTCKGQIQFKTELALDVQNIGGGKTSQPVTMLKATPTGYWRLKHTRNCNLAKGAFTLEKLLDITPIREDVEKSIEKTVKGFNQSINLSDKATKALEDMARVRKLQSNVWLVPNVKKATLSQIHGKGSMLHFAVGVHAQPSVVFSHNKPSQPKFDKVIELGKFGDKTSLNLLLSAQVPFKDISVQLKQLIGKALPSSIILDSVVAFAHKGNLAVKVKVSSVAGMTYKGHIYATAKPVYDYRNGVVVMKKLKLTKSSEFVLKKLLTKSKYNKLQAELRKIQSIAKFTTTEHLYDVHQKLKGRTKNLAWQLAVDQAKLLPVALDKYGIHVGVRLNGSLAAKLTF